MEDESFLDITKSLEFVLAMIDDVIKPKIIRRRFSLGFPDRKQDEVVYYVSARWIPQGYAEREYDPGMVIGSIHLHGIGEKTLLTFTKPPFGSNIGDIISEKYVKDHPEVNQQDEKSLTMMANELSPYLMHIDDARKAWEEFKIILAQELALIVEMNATGATEREPKPEEPMIQSGESVIKLEPWEQIPDHLWDRLALQKWWEGYDRNGIGKAVGVSPAAVTNRISELRHQYLVDIVPTDEQRKKFLREKKQRENS